jgi:uncharacterized protein with HEPN domain
VSDKSGRALDYLGQMVAAADDIRAFTDGMNGDDFVRSRLVAAAVIRCLEIIGEASRRLQDHCPTVVAKHPSIPWREIYRVRNRVAHGYDTVDLEVVWIIVKRDVPALARELAAVLNELRASPP